MRLTSAALLSLLLLILCGSLFAQKTEPKFVNDELLVKFRSDAKLSAIDRKHASTGASVLEKFPQLGWQRVRIPAGMSLESAVKIYNSDPNVEAVQPNYYYHLLATPNDPQFSSPNMYGLVRISAPQAWDVQTGSSNVVVAVIDTGVRYTHQDLAANMWTNPGEVNGNGVDDDGNGFADDFYGYDFFFNDSNPLDEHGHGTHVSGTIGAVGNNSIGVVGVNWNVRIMAVKIYDSDGRGTTSAMLVNAYNYVRLMKNRGVNIRVTNNSYGGCDEACGFDQATKDAIDALGNSGVLNVFAAGNNNSNNDTTPHYPSNYTSPIILSVAASTSTDSRAGFSNFGAESVDIAAPGSSILSTWGSSDTAYQTISGTSMATPHVAGAAALLSSHNQALSAASLKATLMNTADPLTQWNGIVKTGGRLNAANALQNQTVCGFNLGSNSISVPTKGGNFSVNVTAAQNCDYAVKSSVNWIIVSGTETLSGNGTVSFRVRINTAISRSAAISIGGQTFTVTQSRN